MVTDDFGRCTCVQCRWLRTCERQIEESAKNCIVLLIQIVTLQCSIFEAFYRPLGAQAKGQFPNPARPLLPERNLCGKVTGSRVGTRIYSA